MTCSRPSAPACLAARERSIASRVEFERIGGNLLGAHVGEGAHQLSDIRLHRSLRVTVSCARDAEIEDLWLSRFIDQDVPGFEIAMDQPSLMRVMNGFGNLRHG